MTKDIFKASFEATFSEFFALISAENGDWTVKGFIDLYKNIYTISIDTKVVSKIIELMIFPVIVKFAQENDYELILSAHQNHYPDLTFVHKRTHKKIAVDLKSTYRINKDKVNGMTLGAFTGYFRNRNSHKNITFPYSEYDKHYILGVLYAPSEVEIDEKVRYSLDDLPKIASVVKDFDFFLQEKWKIAIDRPGSGNTKNIGSSTNIAALKNGAGIFTKYENGKQIFDDFWMNYLTIDMARAIDLEKPHYHNLKSYFTYKGIVHE
ncbi:MAG: hypothetical protein RLZZ628_4490 [Bacteroidota bacterium]|jgi:hypothetical protein